MSFDLPSITHHASALADSTAVVALLTGRAHRVGAGADAPAPSAPEPSGPTYTFPGGLEIRALPRGVYWHAFVSTGERRPICVAITTAGEYMAYHILQPDEDWRAIERGLRARLDAADPPLRLLAD